jgi:DNA repair exonuclease SbcCD ATPase subunit
MRLQKILFIAIAILALGLVQAQAQKMSRQEKKEFRQKLKNYKSNPDALMTMEDDLSRYRRENQEIQSRMNQLESERSRKDAKIADLEQEISQLNMGMRSAQDAMQQMREQKETMASRGPDMRGLTFRVQIGAYGKTSVPATLDKDDDNFDLETVDGLQRILIGLFRNMDEAEQLRSHMQKIGIRDAWVVPYRDGNRITMEEAKRQMGAGM